MLIRIGFSYQKTICNDNQLQISGLDLMPDKRNENKFTIKISIKKEWDSSPHIYEDKRIKYHHIIRKEERDLLLDFLYRRNEGVLLLSGKRGVGKFEHHYLLLYTKL